MSDRQFGIDLDNHITGEPLDDDDFAEDARTPVTPKELAEALDVLAHIVAQANVNPVGDGDFIERYDMPVGSIHKAIPFLARHGIVVDMYGYIHRAKSAPNHDFSPVAEHADDDECTYRSDGTDATYCGLTEAEHSDPADYPPRL